jgi:hypothetical protein
LQIDDEFERGRLQNRIVGQLSTFEGCVCERGGVDVPGFSQFEIFFSSGGHGFFSSHGLAPWRQRHQNIRHRLNRA